MVNSPMFLWIILATILLCSVMASAQETGSLRGVVRDKDFDAPLDQAGVLLVETGQKGTTMEEGNFLIPDIKPGHYTVVFSKAGYTRQVQSEVVVAPGRMTEIDVALAGEFAQMEEFVAEDVAVKGTEAEMLKIRMEKPALVDSVSKDLISRSGAGNAAQVLALVPGTTVQGGKYATVRGLPDRYVNSQMNGVRLPTADLDKRAVELDQFPANVIESVQVSKTFTPDQQGDASGGAVNVVLRGIPDESILSFKVGHSVNSQVWSNRDKFLTYKGGGVNFLGRDDGGRDIPITKVGESWDTPVGVIDGNAPMNYDMDFSVGGKHRFGRGLRDLNVGGFLNAFYKRSVSYYEHGVDDAYAVYEPGGKMRPQGGESGTLKLFDVAESSEEVQRGILSALGLEFMEQKLSLHYMRTQTTEDTARLAESTRGKIYVFGPSYNPDDPYHPGNIVGDDDERSQACYVRLETLDYVERATETLQYHGEHKVPIPEVGFWLGWSKPHEVFAILPPELDWTTSQNLATMNEPDKRLFGEYWLPPGYQTSRGRSWVNPPEHQLFRAGPYFSIGSLQHIWKDIREESDQWSVNLKLPFRQWTGDEGYVKFGWFDDQVSREYNTQTYANSSDTAVLPGPWTTRWSDIFPHEEHLMLEHYGDVPYVGTQRITAKYWMVDVPVCSFLNIIGGERRESTLLSIENKPERDATWFPPGGGIDNLDGDEADVTREEKHILRSLGFVFRPFDQITIRVSKSNTIARPTFKELTPSLQAEYLGADVFVGNRDLKISQVENLDFRLDYQPAQGSLFSISWFEKLIENPIEYIQKVEGFTYTSATNYPKGELNGWEVEARQNLGLWWEELQGITVGANATFIDSEVSLPDGEIREFAEPLIRAPITKRHMMNAPEHLYNFFVTTELEKTGTNVGLFYTVRGDTLIAGAGVEHATRFIPDVYETEYGTLNFTLSQKIGEHCTLGFKAKNILNPYIETVYRSKYIEQDTTKTSYRKGIDFSFSLSVKW
jgi:outer membrane receptor protein involved in Fe transport